MRTPVILDQARWDELERVNAQVNRDTRYRSDIDIYGLAEFWEIARGQGDCEDYALAKQKRLLEEFGWPPAAVRLAVCRAETGGGHAVLTIDAVEPADGRLGTWVLDNRFPRVQTAQALTRLGYRWIKRQAAHGPAWESIASG